MLASRQLRELQMDFGIFQYFLHLRMVRLSPRLIDIPLKVALMLLQHVMQQRMR